MAIAGYGPTTDVNNDGIINNEDLNLSGSTSFVKPDTVLAPIFSDKEDFTKFLKYIDGQEWSVDYFSKYKENDPTNLGDSELPESIDQYTLIKNMMLNVQTPISVTDEENMTGEALLYTLFKPSVGDMFVGKLLDNRMGIFNITNVDSKSYTRNNYYSIQFTLNMYTETDPDFYNDLLNKVIKNYVFDKDYMSDNSNNEPVLKEETYNRLLKLKNENIRILNYYFDKFIDSESGMFLIPEQEFTTADEYILDFILSITEYDEAPILRTLNRPLDIERKTYSIWDLLKEKKLTTLNKVNRYYSIDNSYLPYNEYGLNFNPSFLLLDRFMRVSKLVTEGATLSANFRMDTSMIPNLSKSFSVDKTYIFSADFYDNTNAELSRLEQLIKSFLNNEKIDHLALIELLDTYTDWSDIEQYYLIPFLIILIKDVRMGNFIAI